MEQDILASVKKSLGIPPEDTWFDPEIVMHINSVFSILTQLGVGPEEGFSIEMPEEGKAPEQWSEFLQNDPNKLKLVRTYTCLKVRQIFDPPTVGSVAEAISNQIRELEWRINATVDPGEKDE